MVLGKQKDKVIFLALYNARKTTFCSWGMVFTVKMVGQKKYFSNFLHTEKSA